MKRLDTRAPEIGAHTVLCPKQYRASTIHTGQLFRAFASSLLGTERDAEGRVWCQLYPQGEWKRSDFPGGKLDLTPALFAEFIANWQAAGSPPLPVDYEHKEDGPASGWIENLRIAADGNLQGAIKWTEEAAADIKADKRRYISPTWAMAHTNRRTGTKGGPWLYGAALTNSPFFDSMPRVAASTGEAERGVDAAREWLKAAIVLHEKHMSGRAPTTGPEGEKSQQQMMDQMMSALAALDSMPPVAASADDAETTDHPQHRSTTMNEEQLKALRAKLGLADNTPVEAVILAAHAKPADLTEKLTAALKSQSDAFDAKLQAAQAETEKLKAERHVEQVEAAIEAGKREGRALDALKPFILAAKSLDDAKKMIAAVSITVPVATAGIPGVASGTTDETKKAQAQIDALVAEKMKAGLSFKDAHRVVGKENKQLFDRAFTVPTTHAATAEN